jgi:hypothetical protein
MKKSPTKLEKKYAPALDNYGQSCFARSDFKKMKCVLQTQMMSPPDHKKLKTRLFYLADKYTSSDAVESPNNSASL